jgi:hypothetical protein
MSIDEKNSMTGAKLVRGQAESRVGGQMLVATVTVMLLAFCFTNGAAGAWLLRLGTLLSVGVASCKAEHWYHD